jgi:hypothetical protein
VRALIALTEGRTQEQIATLERILRTVVHEMDVLAELGNPTPEDDENDDGVTVK